MGLMSISRFCFYDPGVGSFKSCSVFFGKFPLFLCGLWFCFLFSSFLATFFLLISLQENVPLEEVFQRCDSNGLTTESVEERLVIFGHNKLEEKKESKVLKFLGFMWNPLSWVMEAATIMVIALADGEFLCFWRGCKLWWGLPLHYWISRPIWGWQDPTTWAKTVGNSWRTTGDIEDNWNR
ncbi:uncharacterized protein LOC114384584 isoform X5 [Glycine soja]|uniref:uncharacterized protein LOC114384584 isoform X5 n=1 Tax=Glycine soja TaxID=3848 RepID=UPI00103BDD1C|nr:uncharacterized protein LOC114384584 isoform X5 [Glycine soja]